MRGGGGSGETERNGIVEAELVDAIDVVAGMGADVTDGMRAAAWNSDPRVANVLSALPIRQTLEPGAAGRWCIGQIACSPCAQVHSVVSSCAALSSIIDGETSSAACISSHKAVRKARAWRTPVIRMPDCIADLVKCQFEPIALLSTKADFCGRNPRVHRRQSPIPARVRDCCSHVCTSSGERPGG